jgi:hypothetical protein
MDFTSQVTYFAINTGNYADGKWETDHLIVHRERQEVRKIDSGEFAINP